MEAFFKVCPHPDDKQRKELGRRLSLEPLQVKFWFQNKRTQIKESLTNAICLNCGGPPAIGEMSFDEQQLRMENLRLREEIDRISGIAAKYFGKQAITFPDVSSHGPSHSLDLPVASFISQQGMVGEMYGASDLLRSMSGTTKAEKHIIIELAVTAIEELIRMAQIGEPLWVPSLDDPYIETLNEDEYIQSFPRGIGPRPTGLKSEALRNSNLVIMNHMTLVEILMDVNQWSNVFCGIVSRAMTTEVLSTGVAGNYNGALQLMTVEYQVPSPLVPTRENCFVRPSGCFIQEMPNGYSRVTWIEHIKVDNGDVYNMYNVLVNSGLAFGDVRVIATPERRKSMLKLAERMLLSFCSKVGASTAYNWTTLSGSGADDVRVITPKTMDDPGRPPEIDRISGIAAKYVGKQAITFPDVLSHGPSHSLDLPVASFIPQQGMVREMYGASDLLRSMSGTTEAEKPIIIELAVIAMEELIRMAQIGEPLWVPSPDDPSIETLNEDEYIQSFPRGIGPRPTRLKSEALRNSNLVIMNHMTLVEILMDVNQWSNVFCGIVSRAMTTDVLSTGVAGNYNGALQLMTVEYQVPSPLVSTQENYFVRYCKQYSKGMWVVVNVSLLVCAHPRYQDIKEGHLAVLFNKCPMGTQGSRGLNILKLIMATLTICTSKVGASTAHTWTTLSGSGADDVRVITRKIMDDPGRPPEKLFSRGNSLTQQWEHFFTSSGKITLAVGTLLHYQWQNNSKLSSGNDFSLTVESSSLAVGMT
uniref:Homeobox-leucine zipper protein meristem L1-like n=1 Tax=Tanacetum cinerariifolium TaxID=118510 RepID=A0A699GKX9_TANCI|nr:homeobox-leucine zipper protein meristem L1-like [Tanacetum cinerariifolium]